MNFEISMAKNSRHVVNSILSLAGKTCSRIVLIDRDDSVREKQQMRKREREREREEKERKK